MSTMNSLYGMLSAPPSSYGATASRSVSSLLVGSSSAFGTGTDVDATLVLANGLTLVNPGALSLVSVDAIDFPEEPGASIALFKERAEAAVAIYAAHSSPETVYFLFTGNGVSFYGDLARAFDSAFVVDDRMTQAVEVVCRVREQSSVKYKDSDYPSHVVVRKVYGSSGDGYSSFSFGCDHSIWKEDGSDLEGGESEHFKSLGGMFQGVRGVAEGNGMARDADKLVKCDRDGTIPVGVLPDSLIVTAEALADEAAAREAGDTRLSNRIEAVNSSLAVRVSTLETDSAGHEGRIAAAESSIASLQEKDAEHDSDIEALEHSVTVVSERVDEISSKQTDDEAAISTLQSDLSAVRQSVDSIDAAVEGLQEDVGEVSAKANVLEQTLTQQQSNWTETSANLSTLTTTVSGIRVQLGAIQASIESLDRRVTDLEGRINDA